MLAPAHFLKRWCATWGVGHHNGDHDPPNSYGRVHFGPPDGVQNQPFADRRAVTHTPPKHNIWKIYTILEVQKRRRSGFQPMKSKASRLTRAREGIIIGSAIDPPHLEARSGRGSWLVYRGFGPPGPVLMGSPGLKPL